MANLLDRFNKQVRGSEKRIFDYLPKITAKGDFKRINDLNVIINSWTNILMTPRRTYINDPEYGSDLHLQVFEPTDDISVETIETEILDRLRIYDDRASIVNLQVFTAKNQKGFSVEMTVDFEGLKEDISISFDDTTFREILEKGQLT
jgi:phage baseplate assembly protein W